MKDPKTFNEWWELPPPLTRPTKMACEGAWINAWNAAIEAAAKAQQSKCIVHDSGMTVHSSIICGCKVAKEIRTLKVV